MFLLKFNKYWIPILLLLIISGCKKSNDAGPPQETDIIFLGHKGAGSNPFNDVSFENTSDAVKEGLTYLDGVEVDIQMSLDSTIWLYHNVDIADFSCDTSRHNTIINMHDSDIAKVDLCYKSKTAKFSKLSELVDLWNASSGGFYVSTEIKMNFTAAQFAVAGGSKLYLTRMANSLAKLLTPLSHPNKWYIEVNYEANSSYFCNIFKKKVPNVYICLLKSGSVPLEISAALKGGYTGISCSFDQLNISAEELKRAKDSGLVIEMWTPDYINELQTAFKLNPTVIQTDNLLAKKQLNVK